MPRNQILPPVSFVGDLSNSGNSLIQSLFVKGPQETNTDRTPSFGDRLRSRASDVATARTPISRNSTQQKPRQIRETDRPELPKTVTPPPENRLSHSKRSRQKAAENQQGTNQLSPAHNASTTSQQVAGKDRTVDRSERTGDSVPATSEPSASVDSLQQNESEQSVDQPESSLENSPENTPENRVDEQSDVDSTSSKHENGNVPAGLLRHVSEGNRSNDNSNNSVDLADHNESTTDGNLNPPAISKGLASALQRHVPNRQKAPNEQDSPTSKEAPDNAPQDSPAFKTPENNDLPGIEVAQPELSEQISQQEEQADIATAGETQSLPDDQESTEQNAPAPVNVGQKSQYIDQVQANDNLTEMAQQPSQGGSAQLQTTKPDGEQNRSSQDQSQETAQNQQDEFFSENTIAPAPNSASELKNQGSEEKGEELPKPQQGVSFSAQDTEQNQKQERQLTPEVDSQTAPVDDTAGKQKAETEDSQPSGSDQKKSSGQVSVHLQPRYSQVNQQTAFAPTPIAKNHHGEKVETLPADQLADVTGQISSSDSSDASSAKSSSVDTLSSASATSARSSGETPAAVQTRPVLEMTRSDMSQKLSSFIQQASESGKAMRIRLDPPELGSMQIEVGRVNGHIVARIEVDNPHARAIVFEQLHLLKASLHQQNLRVDRLEVEINENLTREFTSDQSGNQTSGNQTSENQQQRFGEETEFASANRQSEEQNDQTETETDAHNRHVVGVSEIDVRI